MSVQKSIKVIFDTNIWISFLIGKKLQSIRSMIANRKITVILTDQLLTELQLVTQRPKLRKYFSQKKVDELIEFLEVVGQLHDIAPKQELCRDPKDNFLLDLCEQSKADFLVTGDKDLIELNPFKTTQILTPNDFEKILEKT